MSEYDTSADDLASGKGETRNMNPNPSVDTLSADAQPLGSPAASTYNSNTNTNTMSNNDTNTNDGTLIFQASYTHSDSGNGFMPDFSDSFTVPEGGATAVCSLNVDDWGTLTRSTLNDLRLITWDPTESPRGFGGGLDKPEGFAP